MDDITLKKLNEVADKMIKNKVEFCLDSELLFYMAEKMKSLNPIENDIKSVNILVSREETLKRVLEFYKSVDIDYYSDALDYLLQLKRNKSLKIFDANKKRLSNVEKNAIRLNGFNQYGYICNTSRIYIPVKRGEREEEKRICNKNTDVIYDSETIVHEIAHSFDMEKTEGIFSIAANIKEYNIHKSKEMDKIKEKIREKNKVRSLFMETTAVSFERLYLQYLMDNTNYPKNCIKQLLKRRINNSLAAAEQYVDFTRIMKIKEENKKISNNDIEILTEEYGEDREKIDERLDTVIRRYEQRDIAIRYIIACLFTPTIMKNYYEKGPEVLKKYIAAVKNNSVDEIFNLLQIEKSKKGIDLLFENVKEDVEKNFCLDKKRDISDELER